MDGKLKAMLIEHEGLRLKPYKCPAGFRTVGVGHNYDANPLPEHIRIYLNRHGGITEEMADQLLELDVNRAARDCRKLYPDFEEFPQGKRHALIDMMFNMGLGTMRTFKQTNALINAGKWVEAADNLKKSKWYSQVGNRAKTVCRMLKTV